MKQETLRRVIGKRISLATLAIFLFVFGLWAQKPSAPPPENKVPPEAAAKTNPVKPSEESLAKGKKMYGLDCAMCHGKDGDGKGDMPPEGDRAKDDDIWNMVNYVKSMAKK